MITFEIRDKCKLATQDTPLEAIRETIISSLKQSYSLNTVEVDENGTVTIKGDLNGWLERALTTARIETHIENDTLHYHAEGTVAFGKWPWVWLCIGLFTGIAVGIFIYMLIAYLASRGKPKLCFEDAFKDVRYQFA